MPASKPKPETSARAALTARAFEKRLLALQDDEELRKIQRYFKSGDKENLNHKAAGWMLRSIADKDPAALRAFLDAHAAMPRAMLSNAIEKFAPAEKAHYRSLD